jgi:hypothetical protein
VLFLPSYSPDLNPIEEAFSKIKGIVRKLWQRALSRGVERSDSGGALGHHARGCRRMVYSLWLRGRGSILVNAAVEGV